MQKILIIVALAFVLGCGAMFIYLNQSGHSNSYANMYEMHHGKSGAASQGMMQGHMDDEINMPGVQGKDTTETEVADFRTISQQNMKIKCRVTNLANVISTFTHSKTLEVRAAIVSHVSMMVTQLAEDKNPEVIIQAPTLDAVIDVHEEIEITDTGVIAIQTSNNPEAPRLLQTDAAEVSYMSERGMVAVHVRMSH